MSYEVLVNPRMPEAVVFEEDFDDVAAFFSELMIARSWTALPGGVFDTFIPSLESYQPLTLEAEQFRGYRVDVGQYISEDKLALAVGLSQIEGRQLSIDDFTLCPSVSVGLLVILMALKREGVQTILAELPAYFACIEQATLLGFRVLLLPTLPEEGYVITPDDVERICATVTSPIAVLITSPRYGMGFSRKSEAVSALRDKLRPGDFIIIDEAADQSVPATLREVPIDGEVVVIRTRGLMKGLGLNSARVATIFHPSRLRALFGEIVDLAGGALDAASLALVRRLLHHPSQYSQLLLAARTYVKRQSEILETLLKPLPISISPIDSGYIGTAHIFFPNSKWQLNDFRAQFLDRCKAHRMPIVTGSSMYFPYGGDREIIRINYFASEQNIRASAIILSRVIEELRAGY